ncbi:hypothetical protein JNK13_08010 [bacterium]|nr:hypothetical protein [bacterium]
MSTDTAIEFRHLLEENPKEAFRLARTSKDQHTLSTYAQVFFDKGDYYRAKVCASKANDRELLKSMARAHIDAGRWDDAKKAACAAKNHTLVREIADHYIAKNEWGTVCRMAQNTSHKALLRHVAEHAIAKKDWSLARTAANSLGDIQLLATVLTGTATKNPHTAQVTMLDLLLCLTKLAPKLAVTNHHDKNAWTLMQSLGEGTAWSIYALTHDYQGQRSQRSRDELGDAQNAVWVLYQTLEKRD